jgi:hypothetical protein
MIYILEPGLVFCRFTSFLSYFVFFKLNGGLRCPTSPPPPTRITVGRDLMIYILFKAQNRFTTEKLIKHLNRRKRVFFRKLYRITVHFLRNTRRSEKLRFEERIVYIYIYIYILSVYASTALCWTLAAFSVS